MPIPKFEPVEKHKKRSQKVWTKSAGFFALFNKKV
jgi:hypothetical protein